MQRAPYYWRIQEILHDQLPIIETVRQVGYIAYRNTLENYDPTVWGLYKPNGSSSRAIVICGGAIKQWRGSWSNAY